MSELEPTEPQLEVVEEEILEAFEMYDQINWDRYEARHAGVIAPNGMPVDRNNLHVRIQFMATVLLSTRHELEDASQLATEMLNADQGFSQLIETMLNIYETTIAERVQP